jgi:hypothetical protein
MANYSRNFLLALCLSSLAIHYAAAEVFNIGGLAEVFSARGPRQSALPSNISETFGYNNDIRQGSANGTLYGTMNGMCVVSAAASPADGIEETLFSCVETLIFSSGPYQGSSLTIAGFYAFGRNPPLAIVGGTGRFKGAQGDLNYVLNNSGTYSTVNLSFVTPNFGATVGRCDPTSQSPTQCLSADGSSFVCCPAACGPSNATATCA